MRTSPPQVWIPSEWEKIEGGQTIKPYRSSGGYIDIGNLSNYSQLISQGIASVKIQMLFHFSLLRGCHNSRKRIVPRTQEFSQSPTDSLTSVLERSEGCPLMSEFTFLSGMNLTSQHAGQHQTSSFLVSVVYVILNTKRFFILKNP